MSASTDLKDTPLADLRREAADNPTLKAIMLRVFKPEDRDKLTVSAFGSAL